MFWAPRGTIVAYARAWMKAPHWRSMPVHWRRNPRRAVEASTSRDRADRLARTTTSKRQNNRSNPGFALPSPPQIASARPLSGALREVDGGYALPEGLLRPGRLQIDPVARVAVQASVFSTGRPAGLLPLLPLMTFDRLRITLSSITALDGALRVGIGNAHSARAATSRASIASASHRLHGRHPGSAAIRGPQMRHVRRQALALFARFSGAGLIGQRKIAEGTGPSGVDARRGGE